jgi:hypothetical protein
VSKVYGKLPVFVWKFLLDLPEVMYYLYLPVCMEPNGPIKLPPNIALLQPMVELAEAHIYVHYNKRRYNYIYVSARKGYATPDNPLNRPGWHCDGFGTDDLNFVWWTGPGTRFAHQAFEGIVSDHNRSMQQFDEQVKQSSIVTYGEKMLFMIDPTVVHATPIIPPPGCMRQYVKISFSDHQYNLENNSHNHLFTYKWGMHSRDSIRNDPHRAQLDYVA